MIIIVGDLIVTLWDEAFCLEDATHSYVEQELDMLAEYGYEFFQQ